MSVSVYHTPAGYGNKFTSQSSRFGLAFSWDGLKIDCAVGSNSRASSLRSCVQIAPDRPSVAGIPADKRFGSRASDTSTINFMVSTKPGQLQLTVFRRNHIRGRLGYSAARGRDGQEDCTDFEFSAFSGIAFRWRKN